MKKMILIICPELRQQEVRDLLARATGHAYTEIPRVIGAGQTGPHLGTHVFPGAGTLLFAVTDRAPEVLAALRAYRQGLPPDEGVRAFVLPVEEAL